MKTKKGFNLREVCGEHIVVAEGIENIDFTNIISMNESSAYLWEKAQAEDSFDEDFLVKLLLEKYEIDEATAQKDVAELVKLWKEADIIE